MSKMRRVIIAVFVCTFCACAGGLLSVGFYRHLGASPASSQVTTQRLQLVDTHGKIRASMEVRDDIVSFVMFSKDARPTISMSVPGAMQDSNSLRVASGYRYVGPTVRINDPSGREAIRLTVGPDGYGLLSFADQRTVSKLMVGYFSNDDLELKARSNGAWGVYVNGRDSRGSTLGTGIGMLAHDGNDGAYFGPHAVDKAK